MKNLKNVATSSLLEQALANYMESHDLYEIYVDNILVRADEDGWLPLLRIENRSTGLAVVAENEREGCELRYPLNILSDTDLWRVVRTFREE